MRFFTIACAALLCLGAPPSEAADKTPLYAVVINHEEQYSIWPEGRALPRGWQAEGQTCTEKACLAYIREVWTDMRPMALEKNIEVLRKLYE